MPTLDPRVQLTLLYGDAPFLIDREARAFVNAILPPEDQAYGLTVTDLDVAPVADALADLRTGSLLGGTRVLLLDKLHALKAEEAKAVAHRVADLPPATFVVMTYLYTKRPTKKGLPVTAALAKVIEAKGQSAEFITPYERELAPWAIEEARRLGKRLDPPAAEMLVGLTGRDHGALASELAKLATYVGEADRIGVADVSEVAVKSAEATSFDLVDAIAEGNAAKALALLPDLVPAQNAASAAIPLFGMIARNLRLLWQAGHLARHGAPVDRGAPPPALAELLPAQHNVTEAARSGFVARKLAGHARNFTDALAAVSLERVLYADRALKGQTDEHLDPRLVVERLVTELCLLAQRSR